MDKVFEPTIGKDVIESLTLGMYDDCRFIFREYIQNSADQIDKAIQNGLLDKKQAEIHIKIDVDGKRITFEDNATGIQGALVAPILQNIAQSTKQRGVDKGFRGIGRLGGLAYCKKLVFETSFKGENVKSVLSWNAEQLKDILNNRGEKEDAASVIKEITTLSVTEEDVDKHYFNVILDGVTNNELLDKKEIGKYLSVVAPVPFSTRFIYKSEVYNFINNKGIPIDEYKIYLNSEQVFKGYSTYIKKDESQAPFDEVIDITLFEEFADDGRLLYWGWHSLSEKNQSLNQVNYTRGFRLRKSNIEIGDEYTLLKLHRDKRFHFHFFGEIHGVHPDLIPNSRRDYFTENRIHYEFENKLKHFFHTHIYKLCYTASEINSSVRKIEDLKLFEDEFQQKRAKGFTDKKEIQDFQEKYERKKDEAVKAQKKIEKIEQDAINNTSSSIQKILNRAVQPIHLAKNMNGISVSTDEKPKLRTDNFSNLNKDQRKFLGKILTIIRDVLDKNTAESLIQKIEEEMK